MDDDHLDAAIDDTARQMIAGEPRADIRDRVLARIDKPSAFPLWRPILRPVAILAVALLVAVGVLVFRSPARIAPRQAVSPPRDQPLVRVQPDTTAEPTSLGAATQARLTPAAIHASASVQRRADTTDADVDALQTPAIDIESIRVAALPADESLAITPLQPVLPIAVAPLGVENQGDRP